MSAFEIDPKRLQAFVKKFGTTIDAFSRLEADEDGVSVPDPHATGIAIAVPAKTILDAGISEKAFPVSRHDESVGAVDLSTLDAPSLLAYIRVAESTQERLERAEWLVFALLGYTIDDYRNITGG